MLLDKKCDSNLYTHPGGARQKNSRARQFCFWDVNILRLHLNLQAPLKCNPIVLNWLNNFWEILFLIGRVVGFRILRLIVFFILNFALRQRIHLWQPLVYFCFKMNILLTSAIYDMGIKAILIYWHQISLFVAIKNGLNRKILIQKSPKIFVILVNDKMYMIFISI